CVNITRTCGSWLACDSGVTDGAGFEFELPVRVQKWLKIRSSLYPMHHLISLMRHFALFLCASRLLQSGAISYNDNQFAETFP
ncbi:MAG: hypothetical protein ACRES5_28590, partial [Pseudomonas sp.]